MEQLLHRHFPDPTPVFRRCLFCREALPAREILGGFRTGRRVAYDPETLRLWAICDGCHRWTLAPTGDRGRVVHHLERLARDRGRFVAGTANIALLDAADLLLVRVGEAGRTEQAWWRYGRELIERRDAFERPGIRLGAYTYGAMAYLGDAMGLAEVDWTPGWDDRPMADVLRWRHFGWAVWKGRAPCPFCNSVLRALRFDLSWWVHPLADEDGRMGVGVPCSRCDPWTPEKIHRLTGPGAEDVLRRVLAYQHISGASETVIRRAAMEIEAAGSAGALGRRLGDRGESLWRLGPVRTVALEIALNETLEERLLREEARELDFLWRRENLLASIIDGELGGV